MSDSKNESNISKAKDRIMLSLAVLLLVAGVIGYYLFTNQLASFGFLVGGILLALTLFFTATVTGKKAITFVQEAKKELYKVVWPTRQETTNMTLYVLAFVAIVAVFLWLVDKLLEWGIFSLILGWR